MNELVWRGKKKILSDEIHIELDISNIRFQNNSILQHSFKVGLFDYII